MDKIPLSQLINLVTSELRKAEVESNRSGNDFIMEFEECELEMAIEIETGGAAEANVWVFKLGGDVKKTDTNTIRIKFTRTKNHTLAFEADSEDAGPELGQSEDNT